MLILTRQQLAAIASTSVTERRQAEHQLKQARDTLRRINALAGELRPDTLQRIRALASSESRA